MKLPDNNVHPWLPDDLVNAVVTRQEMDEMRAKAEENLKVNYTSISDSKRELSEFVLKLLKESERKSKVHTIEQGRSLDKLNQLRGE